MTNFLYRGRGNNGKLPQQQNGIGLNSNAAFRRGGNHRPPAASSWILTAIIAGASLFVVLYVTAPADGGGDQLLVEQHTLHQHQHQHQQERRQSLSYLGRVEKEEEEEGAEEEEGGEEEEVEASQDDKQLDVATATKTVSSTQTKKGTVQVFAVDSQSTQFSTVPCTIQEFHYPDPKATGAGSQRPTILRDYWDLPHGDHWTSEASFLETFADIPYYIKDRFVQVRNHTCVAQFKDLWNYITGSDNNNDNDKRTSLLAFTNDKENPALFQDRADQMDYHVPEQVQHIDSFAILSTMTSGQSHEFHRHGESWIGQTVGHKVWWFLPPSVAEPPENKPPKVNACDYLTGKQPLPSKGEITTCVQSPGDIIWFPKDWFHATCSLTDWTVGIGKQLGPRIRQNFPTLDQAKAAEIGRDKHALKAKLDECSGGGEDNNSDNSKQSKDQLTNRNTSNDNVQKDQWEWFDGDMNQYYNQLEKDHKRNPTDINKYAVHRWMGPKHSTVIHYELIHDSILRHMVQKAAASSPNSDLKVMDAGCGLGSALMWMEQTEPSWKLTGRTLSEGQLEFINQDLPKHNFEVQLGSFDDLNEGAMYDAIYSIEAMIHSYDIVKTLTAWSAHLHPDHGTLVIIDDFLMPGVKRDSDDPEIEGFRKGWLANALYTVTELSEIARRVGLELVESRDLLAEYRIVELNYRNQVPNLSPDGNRKHQGWAGSKYRQKLTVEGKLGYNMVTFRKIGDASSSVSAASATSSRKRTTRTTFTKLK